MTQPDEELELPDVGTVDDTDPVDVEAGDETEVAPIPDEWDEDAHADEFEDDPLVDTTEVELEGDEDDDMGMTGQALADEAEKT